MGDLLSDQVQSIKFAVYYVAQRSPSSFDGERSLAGAVSVGDECALELLINLNQPQHHVVAGLHHVAVEYGLKGGLLLLQGREFCIKRLQSVVVSVDSDKLVRCASVPVNNVV